MATREEVQRTDNSKLGREVLNRRGNVMRGLRGTVDVAGEVKKAKKSAKKAKKTEKKD